MDKISSEQLKKSNRLVTAELQKMPHFDPFPRPVEIDPYVFTNTFLLSAPTQVPKIQAAKSGGVSGHLVDRGLMVLDKKGKMVTGRKHPRMWLARVEQGEHDIH